MRESISLDFPARRIATDGSTQTTRASGPSLASAASAVRPVPAPTSSTRDTDAERRPLRISTEFALR